jgi:hypothetical protein
LIIASIKHLQNSATQPETHKVCSILIALFKDKPTNTLLLILSPFYSSLEISPKEKYCCALREKILNTRQSCPLDEKMNRRAIVPCE